VLTRTNRAKLHKELTCLMVGELLGTQKDHDKGDFSKEEEAATDIIRVIEPYLK